MISMARTLGAPESVPAGNVGGEDVHVGNTLFQTTSTLETMCITWEYFSITILSVTLTSPVLLMPADVVAP